MNIIYGRKQKMSESASKKISVCNLVCAILMGIMLILQFVPFWESTDGSVSINSMVWLSYAHGDLERSLAAAVGEGFSLNKLVVAPIFQTVTALIGIFVCLKWNDSSLSSLLPAACGALGLWRYLAVPAMQLGNMWVLHLLVSAIMLVVAVVSVAAGFGSLSKE